MGAILEALAGVFEAPETILEALAGVFKPPDAILKCLGNVSEILESLVSILGYFPTQFGGFSARRAGERSEPCWRAKRAPLASEASPVWLAIPLSLSVALAWDAPKILKVWITCPQGLFLSATF